VSRTKHHSSLRTICMPPKSIQDRISLLIKGKRRETGLGVREAAKVAKISAATFSRLERGLSATLPDVATLEKLAKWLGVTLGELLGDDAAAQGNSGPATSIVDLVEVHLRADKDLTPETARALADMFKALYLHATKKPET
jgi:transcriptional regulator with XRE-family HTH domain